MKIVKAYDAYGGALTFTVGDNTSPHGDGTPTNPKGWIVAMTGNYDMSAEHVPMVDAESIEPFERGNESTVLTVTADYGFATEAERDLFVMSLQSAVPKLAHVEVSIAGTVFWLPSATTRPIRWDPIGEVACIVNYTFTGKKMVNSARPPDVT